jgi:hypothetical protein
MFGQGSSDGSAWNHPSKDVVKLFGQAAAADELHTPHTPHTPHPPHTHTLTDDRSFSHGVTDAKDCIDKFEPGYMVSTGGGAHGHPSTLLYSTLPTLPTSVDLDSHELDTVFDVNYDGGLFVDECSMVAWQDLFAEFTPNVRMYHGPDLAAGAGSALCHRYALGCVAVKAAERARCKRVSEGIGSKYVGHTLVAADPGFVQTCGFGGARAERSCEFYALSEVGDTDADSLIGVEFDKRSPKSCVEKIVPAPAGCEDGTDVSSLVDVIGSSFDGEVAADDAQLGAAAIIEAGLVRIHGRRCCPQGMECSFCLVRGLRMFHEGIRAGSVSDEPVQEESADEECVDAGAIWQRLLGGVADE